MVHDVGRDVESLRAEPFAGTAEAGDHLVQMQQHIVLLANALHLLPIALRWEDQAARALHRLGGE